MSPEGERWSCATRKGFTLAQGYRRALCVPVLPDTLGTWGFCSVLGCLCVCISHGPLGRLALSSLLSGVCMCLNAVNICFNTTSNSVPLSFGKNCLTPYFLISIKLFLPLKLDIYISKCNILLALQEQKMGQNPKCLSYHHETQTTL